MAVVASFITLSDVAGQYKMHGHADTPLRLGRYFGNSPKFWLGLQNDYDLEEAQRSHATELARIPAVTLKAA